MRRHLREALKRGSEYYVPEWSFRRANSRISEGSWHRDGAVPRVKY